MRKAISCVIILLCLVAISSAAGVDDSTPAQKDRCPVCGAPKAKSQNAPDASRTPTETGIFPITVGARDANGCTGLRYYVLVVTCDGVILTLDPGTLPTGTPNIAYGPVNFTTTGGSGTYVYYIEAGTLPAGMTFTARLTEESSATRLEVDFDATAHGLFKLIFPIFVRVMRRQERQNMENIKTSLEGGVDRAPA